MKKNTEVVIVKKGKKVDSEDKKRYDYSTREIQIERELDYRENMQDILKSIKF